MDLYNFSRNDKTEEHKEKQKLLLSLLAYKGISNDVLLFFQRVSNYPNYFRNKNPPTYQCFVVGQGYSYKQSDIKRILECSFSLKYDEPKRMVLESSSDYEIRARKYKEEKMKQVVAELEPQINAHWSKFMIRNTAKIKYAIRIRIGQQCI